jgi:trehalose-phosphatase
VSLGELAGVPERLWREARAAGNRLLAVDYDGTLAPFAVDPAAAAPLPAARAALERLTREGRTRCVVLSGRQVEEVAARLGPSSPPIVGEHGWSLLAPGRVRFDHPLAPGLAEALDAWQARLGGRVAPARLERKRTALVVHTRGLAPGAARSAERTARRLYAEGPPDPRLALRAIDGGLELRARGRDKGSALLELARDAGPEAFVVAIGDDDTDEDAFRAAASLGGWGVRVGARRASAARATLASPAEVARFLVRWADEVDAPAAAAPAGAGREGRP